MKRYLTMNEKELASEQKVSIFTFLVMYMGFVVLSAYSYVTAEYVFLPVLILLGVIAIIAFVEVSHINMLRALRRK